MSLFTFAFGHILLSFVKLAANISLTVFFCSQTLPDQQTPRGNFLVANSGFGHQGVWSKVWRKNLRNQNISSLRNPSSSIKLQTSQVPPQAPRPSLSRSASPPVLPQFFPTQRPLGMKSPTVDWNSAWRQDGLTWFWIQIHQRSKP